MERKVVEFSGDCRDTSPAMESLRRARQRAGIRESDIKPAARRSAKKAEPATGKTTKPASAGKVISDIRVTLARTEADIKQHEKRVEELKQEIEKLSLEIGPKSMTVSTKIQELETEKEKVSKLRGILSRCRKLL